MHSFSFGPGAYRLLLAIMVVAHHLSRFALGELAVYAFFMLSGFWMADVWLKKYHTHRRAYFVFIQSRVLRLLPLFIIANIFGAIVNNQTGRFDLMTHLINSEAADRAFLIFCNLFILGYNAQTQVALVPAWSLDVEVQFYLLLPLFILLCRRTTWLGLAVLAGLGFYLHLQHIHLGESVLGYAPFFFAGILAHQLEWQPQKNLVAISIAASLVIISLCLAVPGARDWILGGSQQTPGFLDRNKLLCAILAIVLMPTTIWSTRLKATSTDKTMGDLSYSLYLFHSPLAVIFGYHFGNLPPLERIPFLAGYFIISMALAYGLTKFVDTPLMKWREAYIRRIW